MQKKLTGKIINRLTLYHYMLTDYADRGIEFISSPQIAELLNIDNSQIRKDIQFLNNTGKCKIGYCVKDLKDSIEHTLGFKNEKDVFIIGAGNLGTALAKYDGFKYYGLNVLALFDNDPLKLNFEINNKKVYHIGKLKELAKKMNVETVILTVPRKFAQESADISAEAGIKYIWNFAPSLIKVPKNIQVRNENFIGNFLQFTFC